MSGPITRTARIVIEDALRTAGILGAHEVPSSEDASFGLRKLINLLASWSADPGMNYRPDLWGTTATDENRATPWSPENLIGTPLGKDRVPVLVPETVTTFDSSIVLPGEYFRMLDYGLAIEMLPSFERAVPDDLRVLYTEAMAIVKRRNHISPSPTLRGELPWSEFIDYPLDPRTLE